MAYSVPFCEREYNARAAIAEHPQIFARWAAQAAAARAARPCQLDLRYGDAAGETLDFFPAAKADAPLLVFIHGGYWRSLDKADFSWLAPPFVDHGAAVALLNYGLAPATPLEDIVRHVLRALAWLYRHGARYGYDPQRIVVSGHSAGGHLAAMALAALWPVFDPVLPPKLVKAGLAISGLYDLEPLIYAPFVNDDLRLDRARAYRLSPVHLPPATDAPLATAVGALESAEFRRQNALIAQHWPQVFLRDVPLPGANHLTVCDALADLASPLFDCAIDLLQRARAGQ
jgi:arylformamidase